MDEEEFASDTSDDDYVPSDVEAVSEDDQSGEEEAPLDNSDKLTNIGKRKRTKKKSDTGPRKRQGGIKLDEDAAITPDAEPADDAYSELLCKQIETEKQEKQAETEKKKADDLWADFMKDVGPTKPKPKSTGGSLASITKVTPSKPSTTASVSASPTIRTSTGGAVTSSKAAKVTITKEYDFAGEVVKITKEVDADSKEAKAELNKQETPETNKPSAGPSLAGLKKAGGGGLGSVLGKIGKKEKISTLEKSKLDWNSFKQKEGIDEELQIHNRGKASYIERQAFLERADYRQFEIERNIRLGTSKR